MSTGNAVHHARFGIGQIIRRDLTTGAWFVRFIHGTEQCAEHDLGRVYAS